MTPTRRGFIGGCIGMVALKVVCSTTGTASARCWLQTKRVSMSSVLPGAAGSGTPDYSFLGGGWAGIRNDGMLFFTQSPEITSLNGFLDPSCDCTLGHFCRQHESLQGGPYRHKTRQPTYVGDPVVTGKYAFRPPDRNHDVEMARNFTKWNLQILGKAC